MFAPNVLQSVLTMPMFASRAFSAIFVTALFARFTSYVVNPPAWFIHDYTLIVLGLLTVLEFAAEHNVDARQWLIEVDRFVKPSANFLMTSTLVGEQSAALLAPLSQQSSILGYSWGVVTALGVWFMTGVRNQVMGSFIDFDEEDDLGVQKTVRWLEDFWVIGGIAVAFIFPLIAIGLFILTLVGLFVTKKYFEHRENKQKVPCAVCEQPIHPSAPTCFSCRHQNHNLHQVGLFGQPTKPLKQPSISHDRNFIFRGIHWLVQQIKPPVTTLEQHRMQLLSRKRCPVCATRLKQRAIRQACSNCGTETFPNASLVDQYLKTQRRKLRYILPITFFLSLIPLLGLIPGVLYYRLNLISSLRGYVPRSIGCLSRWGVRLLNLILISLQWVPVLGGIVLPIMCWTNYWVYEQVLQSESRKTFGVLPEQAVGYRL